MQVKNKLCLAVWALDGALESRVGFIAWVGLYQVDDASQGLFLILQAMRESGMVGCGTALFCGGFCGAWVSFEAMETAGPNIEPGRFVLLKRLFVLSYQGSAHLVWVIFTWFIIFV